MYKLPSLYRNRPAVIIEFIRNNPFAIITGFGEMYPVALANSTGSGKKDTGFLHTTS